MKKEILQILSPLLAAPVRALATMCRRQDGSVIRIRFFFARALFVTMALVSSSSRLDADSTDYELLRKLQGNWLASNGEHFGFTDQEHGSVSLGDEISLKFYDLSNDADMKFSAISGADVEMLVWFFVKQNRFSTVPLRISADGESVQWMKEDAPDVTWLTLRKQSRAGNATDPRAIGRLREGVWRILLDDETASAFSIWKFSDRSCGDHRVGATTMELFYLEVRIDDQRAPVAMECYSVIAVSGGNKLFFKKRDGSLADFDLIFVEDGVFGLKGGGDPIAATRLTIEAGDSFGYVRRHPDSGIWQMGRADIHEYTGGFRARATVSSVGRPVFGGDCWRDLELTGWVSVSQLVDCESAERLLDALEKQGDSVARVGYECLCQG